MSKARLVKQLFCKIPNRVGLLADVTDALKGAGVNISAICAYEQDGRGEFMLITDDNAKSAEAMGRLNADVVEQKAVAVEMPDRVGALQEVAKKIAEAGVNIEYMYATTGGGTATAIFKTADDEKVVAAVNG